MKNSGSVAPTDTNAVGMSLPLAGGRNLELRTSEGSWISLDVSPDGRMIVFDLLGDLYLLPIEGGRARPLTSGMAFDCQPRFSPDGQRVLFVSDRSGGENLWIISIHGQVTKQITRGNDDQYTSPTWMPDGRQVIASKTQGLGAGAAKPWVYDVETGSGMQLVTVPHETPNFFGQLKLLGAAFGPDSRYVWFAKRHGDWQYNAVLPQYQLARFDRETGKLTNMSNRYGSGLRPALSRDGRWLTYGTRHDQHTGLILRDLRTGDERWLAYPIQRDEQESMARMDTLPGYAFTPDSQAVVLSYGGGIWRVPVDGSAPVEIPFKVETRFEIGPELKFSYRIDDAPEFTVKQIRDSVPSPDGQRLAFTALNRLYVMDWPGGEPRQLAASVSGGKFYPAWSPDGRSLAFVTWDDREGGYLWRTPVDGRGEPRRLSDLSGYYQQTAWSPDGERVVALRASRRVLQEVFSAGRDGGHFDADQEGAAFVWVPAGGGEVNTIAPRGGRSHPHFAGNAERIYACSAAEGVLVSFLWDGSDVREHLKVTGSIVARDGQARELAPAGMMRISPTGKHAVVQLGGEPDIGWTESRQFSLYVVEVPPLAGEVPTVSVFPESAAPTVRQLTELGGEFPAWSADGRQVHWSLGNAHFVYDLQEAAKPSYRAFEERITIRVRRDIPQGTAVLRGARVITMRGREIIEDADIVIRGHRIEAIGARGRVAIPEGSRVIDVAGKTIIPGFVDLHYHAYALYFPGVQASDVWQYATNLAYGVTTTRDPDTNTYTDVFNYEDRIEAGELLGPRLYSAGPGIRLAEGIRSLEHARTVLRRYAEYFQTHILKLYHVGNRQQRQWVLMAARELRLITTCSSGYDTKLSLTQVIDGHAGVEHNIGTFPLYRDVLDLYKSSGVTNTPTLLVTMNGPFAENWFFCTENVHDDPKLRHFTPHMEIDRKTRRRGRAGGPMGATGWALRDEHVFDLQARFNKDLIEAGGNVAVGSHGQLEGLCYHWELWAIQSGGMSTHDALRAATILGAKGLGFDQDIGSIEPGKLADLIVLDRDPLVDIRNTNSIRYVMKNGRLYEGDTLNEIYPRSRPFERRYYWEEEPNTAAGIRSVTEPRS